MWLRNFNPPTYYVFYCGTVGKERQWLWSSVVKNTFILYRNGLLILLRLAATLGSKSTFKKLPKRSVLTADISQLCDLIAEPAEPLALRLSSNLMVGVAR